MSALAEGRGDAGWHVIEGGMRVKRLIVVVLLMSGLVSEALAQYLPARPAPALSPEEMTAPPALSPDAVPPDPALAPSQMRSPPVLSPDAVRPEPALSPEQMSAPPVLSPNDVPADPVLRPN